MAVRQWQQGIELMLTSFEIAFGKLSILDKFGYVQKMFMLLKNFANQQNTLGCLETLLNVPKIVHYIDWQEKNPQMMIVLKIYVRQLFTSETQIYIDQQQQDQVTFQNKTRFQDLDKIQQKINKSEMVDDDQQTKRKFNQLIEESHDLEYHERQNFFNGVYSSTF